jgi:hypothetical protein
VKITFVFFKVFLCFEFSINVFVLRKENRRLKTRSFNNRAYPFKLIEFFIFYFLVQNWPILSCKCKNGVLMLMYNSVMEVLVYNSPKLYLLQVKSSFNWFPYKKLYTM